MKRLSLTALFALTLATISACSDIASHKTAGGTSSETTSEPHSPKRNGTALAYKHTLVIETAATRIAEGVEKVANACDSDTENMCVVLGRSVTTGDRPAGSLRLRTNANGIEPIALIAAGVGTVARRESEAEDLADAIADTESRLQMLNSYKARLEQLQSDATSNVDALIKVASELSEVQNRIEQIEADAANHKQRIDTEILSINFVVDEKEVDSTTISNAITGFTKELSEGVAAAITGLAYVIPWFVALLPFFFLVRYMWRGRQSK